MVQIHYVVIIGINVFQKNTKQQRTLHGGLRIPKEQQRKGGGQARNGERWDEKGPQRNGSILSKALFFKMCTWWVEESCESMCCDKSSRRCPSLLLRPLELGEGIPTWAQTHSVLQLISPPSPPSEPFNEGWHLAEAGIEARPFNGSSSQKVLASQEHMFCHMLPPVSAMHPQGWRLQLATGSYMWLETLGVSSPELGWRAEQGCSVQSPGPLPGLGTLSVFCTGDAVWTAKESTSDGHQLEGES